MADIDRRTKEYRVNQNQTVSNPPPAFDPASVQSNAAQRSEIVPTTPIEGNRPEPEAVKEEAPAEEWFPVILKRNYRPEDKYRLIDLEGEAHKSSVPYEEQDAFGNKVKAGMKIGLPKDEAKKIIKLGIGIRGDEID